MSDWGKENKHHDRQMQFVSAQQDHIQMLLKQMGASVTQISGLVCFVRFQIGDTELLYVYNLNVKDEYYLQRVKPYPMTAGVFPDVVQIAEFIEKDLHMLRNAAKSGQFSAFVNANLRINALGEGLEEVFMHYNVPAEYFAKAEKELVAMENLLAEIRQKAKPLPVEEQRRVCRTDP